MRMPTGIHSNAIWMPIPTTFIPTLPILTIDSISIRCMRMPSRIHCRQLRRWLPRDRTRTLQPTLRDQITKWTMPSMPIIQEALCWWNPMRWPRMRSKRIHRWEWLLLPMRSKSCQKRWWKILRLGKQIPARSRFRPIRVSIHEWRWGRRLLLGRSEESKVDPERSHHKSMNAGCDILLKLMREYNQVNQLKLIRIEEIYIMNLEYNN